MEISKKQAALLKFIFDKFHGVKKIELEDYSFSSDPDLFYSSAYAVIEEFNVVTSLPIESDTSFMCISDAQPSELCKMISGLQHYHEKKSKLEYGHTVPLITNNYVTNHGWYAALILSSDLFLQGFDDDIEIKLPGQKVYLAILISNEEYNIKIEKGMDALLDYFDEIERDITNFGAALK